MVALSLVLVGPDGNSLLMAYLGGAAQAGLGQQVLEALAHSVQFGTPQVATTVAQVQQAFAGKQLYDFSYRNVGSSGAGGMDASSESTWNLCSDGQYSYQGSAESSGRAYSIPGAGSNIADATGSLHVGSQSSSGSAGQWRIMVAGGELRLVLLKQGGGWTYYTVGNNGNYYTLDGKEVTINASPVCN